MQALKNLKLDAAFGEVFFPIWKMRSGPYLADMSLYRNLNE